MSDDSRDNSVASLLEARYPWVKRVAGPRRGPAANRNKGASDASGEWIVFTDDDCIPSRDWLLAYSEAFARYGSVNVFEGKTIPDRPRRSLAENAPINDAGGVLWSCNIAVRRSLFRDMAGFEELFPHACMEDVEFRYRLDRRGEIYRFLPDATVCHPWKPVNAYREAWMHERAVATMLQLHPELTADLARSRRAIDMGRKLFNATLPGLFQFAGAGLATEVRKIWFTWYFIISGSPEDGR